MSMYLPQDKIINTALKSTRMLPIKTIDNVIVYRGRYDVEIYYLAKWVKVIAPRTKHIF